MSENGHLCEKLTFVGYLCEICSMCEHMAMCSSRGGGTKLVNCAATTRASPFSTKCKTRP
jgi:hypothetical protein